MEADAIQTIAVVGAGLMGHGIAQEFGHAGYEVRLHDLNDEKLNRALANIRANLETLQRVGLLRQDEISPILENIHTGTELADMVSDADVVIEAVYEDLELKRSVFQELDQLSPPHTILTSNTSTLMPSLLAAATARPDRVLVTHYFNPPYLIPLVEIVPGPDTSDEVVSVVRDLLLKVGKRPAIVQKEVPGFIGNRLQAALLREAISLVEHGVATPKDIDIVIRNGFGRRLASAGIFEVFEMAGWDLVLAASKYLLPHLESSREPSPLLQQHVEQGKLGVKTGEGFYKWTPDSAEALRRRSARALVEIAKWD